MFDCLNLRLFLASTALAGITAGQSNACFETSLGTNLGLAEEQVIQVPLPFLFPGPGGSYTDIGIASNGFVWLGTNSDPACCNGYVGTFLAGGPRIAAMWEDLSPPGASTGGVFYNTFPASGSVPARVVITWNAVPEFSTTTLVTAQLQLLANGEIVIEHDVFNGLVSHSMLVGITQGNNAVGNVVRFASLPSTGVDTGTNPTACQFFNLPFEYDLMGYTIHFVPNGTGGYGITQLCVPDQRANYSSYRRGCEELGAFYENFAACSIDLSNRSFVFVPRIGAWSVQNGSGAWFSNFSNNLHLGDEDVTQVNLPFGFPFVGGNALSICVSANGFVWLGNANSDPGCCSGDVQRFLIGEPRIALLWQDLNPGTAGGVFADFDSANAAFVVTWNQVPEYPNTGSNTCQLVLQPTGDFELRYLNVNNSSHSCLVGYSGGFGQADPGNRDLTASVPFILSRAVAPSLDVAQPGERPLLGSIFRQRVTNIPGTAQVGLLVTSLGSPLFGTDLTPYGMPGCYQWINSDVSVLFQIANPTILPQAIPSSETLSGVVVFNQAVLLAPGVNAFGGLVTNAARLVLAGN